MLATLTSEQTAALASSEVQVAAAKSTDGVFDNTIDFLTSIVKNEPCSADAVRWGGLITIAAVSVASSMSARKRAENGYKPLLGFYL